MKTWSFFQALTFFVGSLLITFVVSFSLYRGWKGYQEKQRLDETQKIVAIVQTGPEKEALKTTYLAELMGLSVDTPTSLYAFDLKEAKKNLLSSPLIRKAKVKRMPPNALYVDYEIRHPVAKLLDYRNMVVDKEGYLFPLVPFFSPKELPGIYLGLPPFQSEKDAFGRVGGRLGKPLQGRYWELAKNILEQFEKMPWEPSFQVTRIDVSNAFAPSLGRREIVLFTEEKIPIGQKEHYGYFPKIVRLSTKEYLEQIENFQILRENMAKMYQKKLDASSESIRFSPRIVDLRISHLAFMEN